VPEQAATSAERTSSFGPFRPLPARQLLLEGTDPSDLAAGRSTSWARWSSRPVNRSHIVRFQFDQRVTARINLARVPSLQGFPEQALCCVESTAEDALARDRVLALQRARPGPRAR
jgi:hypothetical protein